MDIMAFDYKKYTEYLNNPWALNDVEWTQWKSDYTNWKKGQYASLASQESKAKEQYANFTSQARSQLTDAVGQMKTAVGRDAIARGISRSTIPGTVIGAETERMNEQYEKQDEAAKTELEQSVKAIKSRRASIGKLEEGTTEAQDYRDKMKNKVDEYNANKSDAKVLSDQLASFEPNENSGAIQFMQQKLDELNKKIKQYENVYVNDTKDVNYDKDFEIFAKNIYNVDIKTFNLDDKFDSGRYWDIKNKFNALVSSIEYNFEKDAQAKHNEYVKLSGEVPDQILNTVYPTDPLNNKVDYSAELQKDEFKTEKGVIDYISNTSKTVEADQIKYAEDYKEYTGIDKSYSEIKLPNINWEDYGYYYENDDEDLRRKEMGLPPKSAMSLYDSPAGKQRLALGMRPEYFKRISQAGQALEGIDPNWTSDQIQTYFENTPALNQWQSLADANTQANSTNAQYKYDVIEQFGFDRYKGWQPLIEKLQKQHNAFRGTIQMIETSPNTLILVAQKDPEGFRQGYRSVGIDPDKVLAAAENAVQQKDKIKNETQAAIAKIESDINTGYDVIFTGYASQKLKPTGFPDMTQDKTLENVKRGYTFAEINALTGEPLTSAPGSMTDVNGQPISQEELAANLSAWQAALGLSRQEIKALKEQAYDKAYGLQPGQIRPFYPGVHDADILDKNAAGFTDEENKFMDTLRGRPQKDWTREEQIEMAGLYKKAENWYVAKYGHKLPAPGDTSSWIATNSTINSPGFVALREFVDTGTFGLYGRIERAAVGQEAYEGANRAAATRPFARIGGGLAGFVLPMGLLESGAGFVLKGGVKAAARAGEEIAGKFLLEGGIKSAGETGAKFIFRGLAPTLEKAHLLLFTGIKGGMSFATYNGISAVINGEPAGQVALRMLEGGVGGFAFNVAGSVLFKGARRAWNSLSKGEKVQVLAGELERAAKDPAVVKSIKNAVADTMSKVETSAKKGLQAAKGGLLDAVKTVKSWLKPGSAEGSLVKTTDIVAPIEEPFAVGPNGKISHLNARKMTDAIKTKGYTLADGETVALKITNGKAVEIRLYNDDLIKEVAHPSVEGTKYRVYQYQGVSAGKQGSLYTDITKQVNQRAYVIADGFKSSAKMAGKEEGSGEYITNDEIAGINGAGKASTKPYSKSRPQYKKGQDEDVWNTHADPETDTVEDPSGAIITWDRTKPRYGQWDMGHIPGQEYAEVHDQYMRGDLDLQEFLGWYRNPDNYRPELPKTNRSHKFERRSK
jgi:hypothetical protein